MCVCIYIYIYIYIYICVCVCVCVLTRNVCTSKLEGRVFANGHKDRLQSQVES